MPVSLQDLVLHPSFQAAVGAALGAPVGAFLFFLLRYQFGKCWAKPKLIKTYYCADKMNDGQEDEERGLLMHHHGKSIKERAEYEDLGARNPVWEWNRQGTGIPREQSYKSVIYGPYSTDCSEPGQYLAVFKIKATGIARREHLLNILTLLTLDVSQYVTDPEKTPGPRRLAIRYVRADELAEDRWQEFEVPFWSDTSGLLEYRIIAKDGKGDQPDNISRFGNSVRIFFDTIQVKRVREMGLPW